MMSTRTRWLLGAAFVAAAAGVACAAGTLRAQEVVHLSDGGTVSASFEQGYGCRPWEYGNPDLFYNFYVPNQCGGVPAQAYLAPRPVPPLVGHTYYTYQPFMPHEFMYTHYRTYRNYYDGGRGMTRAKAVWYPSATSVVAHGLQHFHFAR